MSTEGRFSENLRSVGNIVPLNYSVRFGVFEGRLYFGRKSTFGRRNHAVENVTRGSR